MATSDLHFMIDPSSTCTGWAAMEYPGETLIASGRLLPPTTDAIPYHRIDANEGAQTPTGSNGVGGKDETSEDFDATFAMMPYSPAGPSGEVPWVDPEKLLIRIVRMPINIP